jgi:hypothetical protein
MSSTLILCDNHSCIKLSNNSLFHEKPKHIETRYHYIRDLTRKKEIYMGYFSTKDNVASIFTKALPKPNFEDCRYGLGFLIPSTILKRKC